MTPVTIGNADLFGEPKLARNQPFGLGAAIAGGTRTVERRANDFYPTPPEGVRAAVRAEQGYWNKRTIWEPCARGGGISNILRNEFGCNVIATDIVADDQNEVSGQDILKVKKPLSDVAFTNPPFALARDIIRHLVGELEINYLALLLKATFMNSGASAKLIEDGLAPNRRWDFTWRLDFTGGGSPTMDCCILVWDRSNADYHIGLLNKDGPVGLIPKLIV